MEESARLRIGILGGTFDPVHLGHLVIAQEARIELGLDRIIFIPAHMQPLKNGTMVTSAEARLAMVRLAVADNPNFAVSDIELERGGPSYTADTLTELHHRQPDVAWHFIIGADALNAIMRWHAPDQLIRLARLAAAKRPGYQLDLDMLDSQLPGLRAAVDLLDVPQFDIAAHDIRRRVAEGKPITYWVPPAVEEYIARLGLYQP